MNLLKIWLSPRRLPTLLVLYVCIQEIANFFKVSALNDYSYTFAQSGIRYAYILVVAFSLITLLASPTAFLKNLKALLQSSTGFLIIAGAFILIVSLLVGLTQHSTGIVLRQASSYACGPIIALLAFSSCSPESDLDSLKVYIKRFYLPIYLILIVFFWYRLISGSLGYPAMAGLGMLFLICVSISEARPTTTSARVLVLLLSLKRSVIGASFFVLVFSFFGGVKLRRSATVALVSACSVGALVFAGYRFQAAEAASFPKILSKRIDGTLGVNSDGAYAANIQADGRLVEARASLTNFQWDHLPTLFFGGGFGYEYYKKDKSGRLSLVSGIHVSPVAALVRHGMIGLLFYLICCFRILREGFRLLNSSQQHNLPGILYLVAAVPLSLFSANYITDLLSWAIGGFSLKRASVSI